MTKQPHAAPTPGPWTLETVKTSCGICHKIGPFPWTDTEKNHACVYVDDRMAWKHGPELLANAHLIAAAPETAAERDKLVEALEILVNELEPWLDDGWKSGICLGDCANLHTAQRKARAALAEARKP